MPFDVSTIPAITRLLEDARKKLIEEGWCSKGPRSREGVCALLALREISRDDYGLYLRGYFLLLNAVKEEVLALFDRAIELSWGT